MNQTSRSQSQSSMEIIDISLDPSSIPPHLLTTAITLASMTQKKISLLFTPLSFASPPKNYVSLASSRWVPELIRSSFRFEAGAQGYRPTLASLQGLRYTFVDLLLSSDRKDYEYWL